MHHTSLNERVSEVANILKFQKEYGNNNPNTALDVHFKRFIIIQ